ncbi:MAG: Outer membrane protein TolC precursor [Bacteroidetes bacterium ADurb.Bin416]|nr:MAG: Outer membrane protein TolC precursor [Bacteroidetes bacterium ADurb.Bin416]
MKPTKCRLIGLLCVILSTVQAQPTYNLQACLKQALSTNHTLKKSRLEQEKSAAARQEILGALLPQLNGSASLTGNIQKPKFIMPNFINEFLPANMQDPNASKYMTIEMGTNYSAGVGVTLSQQVLNLSLFNAVNIAEIVKGMAALGAESKEEDVIAQTATQYYGIQVTDYAIRQMGTSVRLIDSILVSMKASFANGLIRQVDLDRMIVTRTNLETQLSAIKHALDIQKNLLKLQMGLAMDQVLEVEPIDLNAFEHQTTQASSTYFDINQQSAYKLMRYQQDLGNLQKKSALYESMPVLVLNANYNYNGVSDAFFSGPTNYWYPNSAVMLNVKVPLFGGLSRSAKLKQARFEQQKIQEDLFQLEKSLNMAYLNTRLKQEDSRKTIQAQKANMALAQDVFNVTESNFEQGLASLSDVLNANSSLIQAQVNYADALNGYMKASLEVMKASGTLRTLVVTP